MKDMLNPVDEYSAYLLRAKMQLALKLSEFSTRFA